MPTSQRMEKRAGAKGFTSNSLRATWVELGAAEVILRQCETAEPLMVSENAAQHDEQKPKSADFSLTTTVSDMPSSPSHNNVHSHSLN